MFLNLNLFYKEEKVVIIPSDVIYNYKVMK